MTDDAAVGRAVATVGDGVQQHPFAVEPALAGQLEDAEQVTQRAVHTGIAAQAYHVYASAGLFCALERADQLGQFKKVPLADRLGNP